LPFENAESVTLFPDMLDDDPAVISRRGAKTGNQNHLGSEINGNLAQGYLGECGRITNNQPNCLCEAGIRP